MFPLVKAGEYRLRTECECQESWRKVRGQFRVFVGNRSTNIREKYSAWVTVSSLEFGVTLTFHSKAPLASPHSNIRDADDARSLANRVVHKVQQA